MQSDRSLQRCGKWDRRFFAVCDLVASWSEDVERGVGCVIVGDAFEVRATGYNGLPRGVTHSVERLQRDGGERFLWIEHAERNALFNAARAGVSVAKCTLYSNCFPCAHCARAIIQSGIMAVKTIYFPPNDPMFAREDLRTTAMLSEAGVTLAFYDWTSAVTRDSI